MSCEFEDRCINSGQECDFCHYNSDAVLQDFFEFDVDCGEEEPTQEELDNAIVG